MEPMTEQSEQQSDAAPTPGQGRTRRARGAAESLLAIVLGLEAALTFFVTVTAFGLKVLPAGIAWSAGALLLLTFLLAARVVRYRWGTWLGWALQAVLVSLGFLMPLMFFIGAGFLALWTYCFVVGRRLDARNQRLAEGQAEPANLSAPADTPTTDVEHTKEQP